jgi:tetratricopeptide (TPR) repeat protein
VDPEFEYFLVVGVAVLVGFWGLRMVLEGRLTWVKCPVTLCLAGLILTAVWQLVPLPSPLLGWISPATARLYEQLLPSQREVLPDGAAGDAAISAGSTLSLYPGQSRQELMRLLAVFLLFAVVRNNVASSASLWRLSLAALINGIALSLFALVQFFTSPSDLIYGTYHSPNQCFGPFTCKNHFAFYINTCAGLGLGLLLGCRYFRARDPAERSKASKGPELSGSPGGLLQDPPALWICAALALMVSSMVFALSRGGVVALLAGAIACLGIQLWRSARLSRLGVGLLIVLIAFALLHWFGWQRVETRLASIWKGKALQESRLPLWLRVLPSVKDFPIWGTGLGTFQYVEPLYRRTAAEETLAYSNAENDYLEALIEGGVLRLVLSGVAVALVLRFGYRAVCRHEGGWRGGLAMGALVAFITLAVESFGDFGLHIPAIAVLATVLCAQLCALGRPGSGPAQEYSVRAWGLAPLAGAALAVVFGLALWHDAWKAREVQELWSGAEQFGQRADPARQARQLELLETAVRLTPESALLEAMTAQAYLDVYRDRRNELLDAARSMDGSQAVAELALAAVPPSAASPLLVASSAQRLAESAEKEITPDEEAPLVGRHLLPALRHFIQARDLCPLLPEPHRCLADHADKLHRGDRRLAYLERAAWVVPSDPVLWYLLGEEHLESQPGRTWESWRRSLELSGQYLGPIVHKSAEALGPTGLLNEVLPDRPAILLAAATELYPEPSEERGPFLQKALLLLETQSRPWKGEDLHLQAQIQLAMDRPEEAMGTFRAALATNPMQVEWRFELAQVLHQLGHFHQAGRELRSLLSHQPGHARARDLLTEIEPKLEETRD